MDQITKGLYGNDPVCLSCTAAVGAIVYAIYGGLMYLFIGLLIGNLYQNYLIRRHNCMRNMMRC
jgi:hypothetical protein